MRTVFHFGILVILLSLSMQAQGSGFALQFDGVNDYVSLGDASEFSVGNAVTYEVWINPDTLHNGWILNKWVAFAEDKQLAFFGNRIYFYLHNVFGGAQLSSASTLPYDQFTHVAAVYDASTLTAKLYINGVLDASKSVGTGVSNSTGGLYIGHNASRGDGIYPFKGMLDEIRIWNIARTESEIQSTMNQPLVGNETGLVGYWNFDEGTGTTTADMTSNGNDGTINGAIWVSSGVALPVELTSFTATTGQHGVVLNWKTATEVDNYGFEVERSPSPTPSQREGTSEVPLRGVWGAVGFVEGSGTSNSQKEYSFTDSKLNVGRYSYRLKQIDNDGKFEYSQEMEVTIAQIPQMFALMQNYPNPFNPTTNIGFRIADDGMVTLKIYDVLGRQVTTLVNEVKEVGNYTVQFDASNLASGLYFTKLQQGEKQQIVKMLLMK